MRKLITSFFIAFLLLVTGTSVFGQAAGDFVFINTVSTADATKMDSLWITQANWNISDGAGNTTAATRLPVATDNVWIKTGNWLGTLPTAITNSTCAITSGSTTVTLAAANTSIKAGWAVRNSDNFYGIAPGTYVSEVSSDGLTVTLSAPATRTASAVKLSYFPSCKNLYVNGRFRVSSQFVAFGNVTVNSGAFFLQGSDLYCRNISNFGVFVGQGGYRSAKNLFFGFEGAIPGTGDYTLINDGSFGEDTPMLPQGGRAGSKLLYSNQANSITIRPSLPTITTGKFNIAQIMPQSNMLTNANTTLNIKQSMSLLIHNGIGLSIQNNDSCVGTTRTCNIDPGVTVIIGYNFHANRNVTTNPQGNFVYNVYGTLDLGSFCSQSNNAIASITPSAAITTDFGLCMTTVSGNTGSLTFNLGDGTTTNAGTLILGSNVKIIKQSTQNININIADNSTVKFTGNYGWQMNYQLLNSNTPALYLFPKKYYNLTVDGAKVVLPVAPEITGTRTYTKGGYGDAANWVTNTTTTAGSILKTTAGGYYYVPVVRTTSSYTGSANPITLDGDTILNYIQPTQTISATGISNYTVSSLSGSQLTMSAAVTSTTTQQTNALVTFTCKTGATEPTGTSTNSFAPVMDGTQGLIYLGNIEFARATTAVNTPTIMKELLYSDRKGTLSIDNATVGDIADVYSVSGMKVASAKLMAAKTNIYVNSGIYIVKINNAVAKVAVK